MTAQGAEITMTKWTRNSDDSSRCCVCGRQVILSLDIEKVHEIRGSGPVGSKLALNSNNNRITNEQLLVRVTHCINLGKEWKERTA